MDPYSEKRMLETKQDSPTLPPALKALKRDIQEVGCLENGEGIDMLNPIKALREETCQKILASLLENKAVLMNAPRYSGKTTLATLLASYCSKQNLNVCWITMSRWIPHEKHQLDDWFYSQLGIASPKDLKARQNMVVIIDEGQCLYSLTDEHPFWRFIKSLMQNKAATLYFFFLASYGERRFAFNGTAVLDVTTCRYSQNEYDELIEAYNEKARLGYFQPIRPGIASLIMHKTLGHPGLVREALVCINTKYDADSRIQNPRRLNDQEIAVELYSRSFISRVAASRAVLTTTLLQPLERKLLKKIIMHPKKLKITYGVTAELNNLITRGVLAVLADNSIEFVAPIIRAVYIQELFQSSPVMGPVTAEFDVFIALCLGRLNGPRFLKAFNLHGTRHPAQWQNEFYKAVTHATGMCDFVSPEIDDITGPSGKLHFFIASGKRWGIELMREGERLEQNTSGCNSGTPCQGLELQDYVAIDFRRASSRAAASTVLVTEPKLWRVVCADDCKSATVYRKDKNPFPIKFLGTTAQKNCEVLHRQA